MVLIFGGIRWVGAERLREFVAGAGPFGPVIYVILRAGTSFVPFSSGPVQLVSGVVFGFWLATLYSVVGSTIGYSISFWLARRYGRSMVRQMVGADSMDRVEDQLDRVDDWRGMIVARFVFYFAYDFVAYAIGLSEARYFTFLIVTFVFGIPTTAATVFVGLVGAGEVALPF